MNASATSCKRRFAGFVLLVAFALSGAAFAQEHGGGGHGGVSEHGGSARGDHGDSAQQHVDTRFSHNRMYYNRGFTVHDEPHGGQAIDYHRGHYRYDRGQWFLGGDLGWVVVDAPLGAFVSALPPFYTTVMFDGVPYYYANDTYYVWSDDQQEYEVVDPPAGIEQPQMP
jgi:hypothetical protein